MAERIEVLLIFCFALAITLVVSVSVRAEEPVEEPAVDLGSIPLPGLPSPSPVTPQQLAGLPPAPSHALVTELLGEGMPAEGPIYVYPDASQKDRALFFWYMPKDREAKNLWGFENLTLYAVTHGDNGEVVWPPDAKGQPIEALLDAWKIEASK